MTSSADLEAKYRKPKKRRAIARVLFNRWWNSTRLTAPVRLQPINFGMEIGKHS